MSDDRFNVWNRRARTCYRGAASIDGAKAQLQAAQLAIRNEIAASPSPLLEDARRELAAAEGCLFMAREKLEAALKEKTLTPDTRPPEFWKAGA